MKTKYRLKQTILALIIIASMASCKKDKKDPDPTQPLVEVKAISLSDLKALSTGASVKVPDAKKISGIVISDISSKNIDNKTVVLQDAATQVGIIITFDAVQAFATGDQLEVNISNQTLAQVNGEVVLQNIPAANAKKTGAGSIIAKATTIADINTNKTALDGTLVTIMATELSGGNGKYTGTLTVKDASGTSTLNVLSGAVFSGTAYPPSVSSITGIVRINGTEAKLDIRKAADVIPGTISRTITENFENLTVSGADAYNGYLDNLSSLFTTSLGTWDGGSGGAGIENMLKLPGSLYDAAFTTPGREYVYETYRNHTSVTGGSTTYAFSSAFTNLQGLKTVTITFAGSTVNSYKSSVMLEKRDLSPFDPAVDVIQISVYPKDPANGFYALGAENPAKLIKSSPQYKKTGEWYSYTYTLPTKAEMLAAGVPEGGADAFLANPNIIIINNSTRTPITSWAPVLFDKIEFGF